ncbi:MAG: hypothetical protein KatS3mg017_0440 [Fimbriimonadales bacterium]|nr:MAG: hypothetical protein KatS3mg017_0440 [Fimbriimonadales bacterium]
MPIRFLKNASEIADVSRETPLPVLETSKERKLVQADPLLTSVVTADTNANRDILNNTSAEQPTLSHCSQYHTLLWTGTKSAATDVNYIIEARSADFDGNPFLIEDGSKSLQEPSQAPPIAGSESSSHRTRRTLLRPVPNPRPSCFRNKHNHL